MKRRDFVLSTLSSPLLPSGWGAQAQTATASAATLGAQARRRRTWTKWCPSAAAMSGPISPDLSQQIRRDGSQAHDVLDPAAGHAFSRPRLSRRLPCHRRRALLQGGLPHRDGGEQAQRPEGGWNYIHDFAGEAVAQALVRNHRRNGWRLEEFQHYYGNATFDDAGTAVAAQFMLRMYLRKRTRASSAPVLQGDRLHPGRAVRARAGHRRRRLAAALPALARLDQSMPMPNPQQLPPELVGRHGGRRLHAARHLQRRRDGREHQVPHHVRDGPGRDLAGARIRRAMECMQRLQQPAPQAGWGLQHLSRPRNGRPAGAPAGARTYEPRSLATHTTQTNMPAAVQLLHADRRPQATSRACRRRSRGSKSCPLPPDAVGAQPAARRRPHAPDLHPAGHQRRDLRAPLRLEHP